MIVVVHQAEGVAAPTEAIDDVGEPIHEERAVLIIHHNVLAGVATTRDMVDGTGIFQAQRTSPGGQGTRTCVRL